VIYIILLGREEFVGLLEIRVYRKAFIEIYLRLMMARPIENDRDKITQQVNFRISPREYDQVKSDAEKMGYTTVSAYLRALVVGAPTIPHRIEQIESRLSKLEKMNQ